MDLFSVCFYSKKRNEKLAPLLCLFTNIIILSCDANNEEVKIKPAPTDSAADSRTTEWQRFHEALDSIYDQLPQVLKNNSMNSQWAIIAHLGIHCGLPRMALIDIKRRKIIDSGCMAMAMKLFQEKPAFRTSQTAIAAVWENTVVAENTRAILGFHINCTALITPIATLMQDLLFFMLMNVFPMSTLFLPIPAIARAAQ